MRIDVDTFKVHVRKKYGFFNFLGDVIMIFLTCGLWLVYIFVREMRRR
jgi:hypothetical protein